MCGSRTTSRSRFLTIGTRDRSKPSLEPISKKSPWTNRNTSLSCSVSIARRDIFTGFVYRSGIFYGFCDSVSSWQLANRRVTVYHAIGLGLLHTIYTARRDTTRQFCRVGSVGRFELAIFTIYRTMYTIYVKTFLRFFYFGHVFLRF